MPTTDKKVEKIADWLEKQVLDSSITDGTIWNKMKLSKTTFYRLKPKAVIVRDARLKARQKTVESIRVQEAATEAKNGLKSKSERLMILQNQVDELLLDIETANKKGSKVSITDKAYLRKTVRDIQAEISKIEGDYAPLRQELTGKNGEAIQTEVTTTVLYLPDNKRNDAAKGD
jgi:hypothetical protein